MTTRTTAELIEAALQRDPRAVARLISLVEDRHPSAPSILATLFPRTGSAFVVGLTGAPGSGKSTLTDQLIRRVRSLGDEVGILAVDPSSPFTGGAILGDRIRMQDHVGDPGVYIRSMGSRGHLGGVAEATPKAIMILDAIGLSHVFVETVGVGQAEVEIVESADTTIVVVNPGWGDSVQANKAGLLEIGDILVVNKADRDGVADTMRDLEQMLDLGGQRAWRPPVLATVATVGEGIGSVWQAVQDHRSFLESTGRLNEARSARLRQELHRAVVAELFRRAEDAAEDDRFATLTAEVDARRLDPWTAARRLLDGG
ncbi:MAG TPA: methylmalonyl Co-A mutase-associated GTPase MeaB [Acidimicrobiia bacterium]|nr:methylmalonyl Co-A mutase-associated GTPase MeaB [Acidimicrobiia bacterium]